MTVTIKDKVNFRFTRLKWLISVHRAPLVHHNKLNWQVTETLIDTWKLNFWGYSSETREYILEVANLAWAQLRALKKD